MGSRVIGSGQFGDARLYASLLWGGRFYQSSPIGRMFMAKALVIEDVPELESFVVAAFEYLRFEAYSVATVADAIEILCAFNDVEAVFISTSDESRIDHLDLATLIAERWPNIQIFVSSQRITRLRDLPPCVYLAKPMNARILISTIENTLRERPTHDVSR